MIAARLPHSTRVTQSKFFGDEADHHHDRYPLCSCINKYKFLSSCCGFGKIVMMLVKKSNFCLRACNATRLACQLISPPSYSSRDLEGTLSHSSRRIARTNRAESVGRFFASSGRPSLPDHLRPRTEASLEVKLVGSRFRRTKTLL